MSTALPPALGGFAAREGELVFGRYRVRRVLGRGGMGMVVLASDELLHHDVALKFLPPDESASAEKIEALKQEVLRGLHLTHPGIVRIFSFEHDGERSAIVMEFVPGENLAEARARQPDGCFDFETVQPWIEQICAAVDYAQVEGKIAHRDLKPRNLLLTPDGRVKVADFGISSPMADMFLKPAREEKAVGTPAYMSPQQLQGLPASPSDDVYALGVTIYELLAGKPPWSGAAVYERVLEEVPPTMEARRVELGITGRAVIPRGCERMVAACLGKKPESRPMSCGAALEMLRRELRQEQAAPVTKPEVAAHKRAAPAARFQWNIASRARFPHAPSAPRRTARQRMARLSDHAGNSWLAPAGATLLCALLAALAIYASRHGLGRIAATPPKAAVATHAMEHQPLPAPASPLLEPPRRVGERR